MPFPNKIKTSVFEQILCAEATLGSRHGWKTHEVWPLPLPSRCHVCFDVSTAQLSGCIRSARNSVNCESRGRHAPEWLASRDAGAPRFAGAPRADQPLVGTCRPAAPRVRAAVRPLAQLARMADATADAGMSASQVSMFRTIYVHMPITYDSYMYAQCMCCADRRPRGRALAALSRNPARPTSGSL